ncbi:MAG: hypothetical protein MJ219_00395 [Mycoplasmoidaceae bacterium]|nr:hypothetical protein [Mycoplasmoidaceae bacterium]
MKKYINILIPLSITLIPISIVGCSKGDGYKSIPKDYLDIDSDHILQGFKEGHQRKHQLEGYNTLTIPNDVVGMVNHSFTYDITTKDYDGPAVIKKIDFEEGCTINRYGTNFYYLDNLETVVFPPQYDAKDEAMFSRCGKLQAFDLTNIIANTSDCGSNYLLTPQFLAKNGQIIIKNGQTNVEPFANYLYSQLSQHG